jgi:hypothetical protein
MDNYSEVSLYGDGGLIPKNLSEHDVRGRKSLPADVVATIMKIRNFDIQSVLAIGHKIPDCEVSRVNIDRNDLDPNVCWVC